MQQNFHSLQKHNFFLERNKEFNSSVFRNAEFDCVVEMMFLTRENNIELFSLMLVCNSKLHNALKNKWESGFIALPRKWKVVENLSHLLQLCSKSKQCLVLLERTSDTVTLNYRTFNSN